MALGDVEGEDSMTLYIGPVVDQQFVYAWRGIWR